MTSDWYQQKFWDATLEHKIEACFKCDCLGAGYDMGHSRAHAHVEKRKICLAKVPKSYPSFLTSMHEIGHIMAEKASYKDNVPRALAEHNATEWAYAEMRKLGLPIKRKYKARYDRYIGNKVARGLRRGLQHVPSVLRKYNVVG